MGGLELRVRGLSLLELRVRRLGVLGLRVWGLSVVGFWVGWGLGVRVWGLGFGVRAAVLENCLTKFFPNTFYSGCMKDPEHRFLIRIN